MSFNIKKEPRLLDGIAECHEHGCPMISVEQNGKDDYMCLFEAVDELIGQQRITGVQVSGGSIRSIQFGNGYQINPLCPCCGKPEIQDSGALKNRMLVGMTWETLDYGKDCPALILYFAKTAEAADAKAIPVHIDSVRSIQRIGG